MRNQRLQQVLELCYALYLTLTDAVLQQTYSIQRLTQEDGDSPAQSFNALF